MNQFNKLKMHVRIHINPVYQLLLTLVLAGFTCSVTGQNQVLLLDGIDDYVDLPEPIIDSDKFTIEAWVKMIGPGGGIETQSIIFEQRDDATGCNHSAVIFTAESRSYQQTQAMNVRTHIECETRSFADAAPYGDWNHYAGVIDFDVIFIYLNGQLRDSTEYIHEGSFVVSIDHITLGKHTHNNAGFGYLNGTMDEIRIWGRPLNQFEILSMMNTPNLSGEETDLLAYWNFDDSAATDLTGNGNDGQLISGATIITATIPIPCEGTFGDLNGDQQHTVSDIQLMVLYILGNDELNFDLDCADLNGDGLITIQDILILINVILNY